MVSLSAMTFLVSAAEFKLHHLSCRPQLAVVELFAGGVELPQCDSKDMRAGRREHLECQV